MDNPFTPNFGQIPMELAGREALIAEMDAAFDRGRNDPNLSCILIGARGTGKTALMSLLAEDAEQRGWLSVNVTALPGMLDDIETQSRRKGAEFLEADGGKTLSGVSVGRVFSAQWDNAEPPKSNWRGRMSSILDELNTQDVGLLITVDEVDPHLDEMIQLAAIYQHFVRENRKVALLMSGLPYRVLGLLTDKSVSFLRRAVQHRLGMIEDYEVARAFRQTVEDGGRSIGDDALQEAAAAIQGFPYMFQLVGFRSWQGAGSGEEISPEDVRGGVELARADMRSRVLRATLDELSDNDIRFLRAMLESEGASTAEEMAERLGRTSSFVSTYKRRLLEQGVIEERGRRSFAIALPGLREFLPEYLEIR